MKKLPLYLLVAAVLVKAAPLYAAPPDAGTILRDTEKQLPAPPPEQRGERVSPLKPEVPAPSGPKVLVKSFRIEGATIFPQEELLALLLPYQGRELDFPELQKAASLLAAYYIDHGYTALTVFPPQPITDGVIIIKIIEGKMGKVEADPSSTSRFSSTRATEYIVAAHPPAIPFSLRQLDRGLLLLNDLPGVSATSTLKQGSENGLVDVVLKMAHTPLVTGSLDFDNFGDRSSGEYRLSGGIYLNNPFGIGDQIVLRALSSIDNNYGRIGYGMPVGTSGARFSTSFTILHYELGKEFARLGARGDSLSTDVEFTYPFVRGREANLSGTSGFQYRHLTDKSFGAVVSDKDLYTGTVGISGDMRDLVLGGGATTFSFGLIAGDLDRSGAADDLLMDEATARTDGTYLKLLANLAREQRVTGTSSLLVSFSGQFAGGNLDSSEKFSLGGPGGIRAYPVNEGSGDHGFVLTTELRQELTKDLVFSAFYDYGWTQLHETVWGGWNDASGTSNSYNLDGAGAAISYAIPGRLIIKGTVATTLSGNPGSDSSGHDTDGTKRRPRFWISMSTYF